MRSARIILLFTAVLAACSTLDPAAPGHGGAALRTDSPSYVLRGVGPDATMLIATRRLTIAWTYTNTLGRDVYAEGCAGADPPVIEKKTIDGWISAYAAPVLLCQSVPVRIAAGGVYRDSLHVVVPLPGVSALPQWEVAEVAGVYRLVWNALAVPLANRTSNEFTIVPG